MRKLLLALIILTPILSFSQKNNNPTYTISGKIIDATTKKPLEDAIIVFKSIDSNQIKFGGITNQKGNFSIDVERETYSISVEFISYETKYLNVSEITRDLNMGVIELELDTEILAEVEIVAEKSTLEFKQNKQIFNVRKDISANGGTATEILGNIPSVSVDPSGNISLRGQGSITVLINGNISSLSKSDALKSLPAGSIETIEVITNPGAKYNASYKGIINIILKKGKDEGLNASLTTTGGYKDYYGGLLTLNYKSKGINFFTNTSYFHRNPIELASYENSYFNNGVVTSFLNENTEVNRYGNAFLTNIGSDFYLSKKSTITAIINFTNIDAANNSNTYTDFFNASKVKTSSNNRKNSGNFNNEIYEFVLKFEQNFNNEGQKLRANVTYSNDIERYNFNYVNSNLTQFDEIYNQKNTLENTTVKIDYTLPVNKTSTYTFGYEGAFGKTPFLYNSDVINDRIDYTDTSHALFIDFEKQTEKLYFGVGLRAESVKLSVDYSNLNPGQVLQYNDLFPSAVVDYSISDNQSASISYSRKIVRPTYEILQPYEQKISETNSFIGNETILPIYIDNADISYSLKGEKITFMTSLFFQRYKDYWQNVTYETGEVINGINKIITTPLNIGKLDFFGLNVTSVYKPNKNLSFTGNVLLTNFNRTGLFKKVNLANKTIIQNFNNVNIDGELSLFTQLKIPNVFNFQTKISHNLRSESAVSARKAYTYANLALSKDILSKNATVSLTVDDLFYSNKIFRERYDDTYLSKIYLRNKYRTILLSFTYRFNQNKQNRIINFDKKEEESKPKF